MLLDGVIARLSAYISPFYASFEPMVIFIIIGMIFNNLLNERDGRIQGTDAATGVLLLAGIAFSGTRLSRAVVLQGREISEHHQKRGSAAGGIGD